MWNKIKTFLTSNTVKRFYWNLLSGAVGGAVTYFSGISWVYAPFIIAILNGISKEMNTYFSNR
jgi:hypothetical protein